MRKRREQLATDRRRRNTGAGQSFGEQPARQRRCLDYFCLVATDLTEQKRSDAIAASEKLAQELLAASNQSRLELLRVIEDQKRAEQALQKAKKNSGIYFKIIPPPN